MWRGTLALSFGAIRHGAERFTAYIGVNSKTKPLGSQSVEPCDLYTARKAKADH
jgi:hypothetical protein